MSPMQRRDFLRWMSVGAMRGMVPVTAATLSLPRRASAAATQAPFFITVQAIGGWDVAMTVNPMGITAANASNPPSGFNASDIVTVGPFALGPQSAATVDFFKQYASQILVINGVDNVNADHTLGERNSTTGNSEANYPVTPALIAAVSGATLAAPFITTGGYTDTENLVGSTLMAGNIVDGMLNPADLGLVRSDTLTTMQQLMADRYSRRINNAVAPIRKQRLQMLQESFVNNSALSTLVSTFQTLKAVPTASPHSANLNALDESSADSIRMAIAGYVNGQTASALFGFGTFDTHSNNDAGQMTQLSYYFSFVDFILRCGTAAGIADNMLVHLASDFGRQPFYNNFSGGDLGKGHWPTTSVIFVDPSTKPRIPVNQIIGQADDGLVPLKVNTKNLALDDSGVTIKQGHIHDAIRRLMGIDTSTTAQLYNLQMTETLPLFG